VTDTNALLGTGSMFVLSRAHARRLLAPALSAASPSPCLLDVGAGDGEVTLRLSAMFTSVTATEVSGWMCRRLQTKGFSRVICCNSIGSNGHFVAHSKSQLYADAFAKGQVYDVVALMNLLDRCHEPAQLLKDATRLLKPTGLIILAIVLPYGDFVEDGGVQQRPHFPLRMSGGRARDGATFEQVHQLAAAAAAAAAATAACASQDNLCHCCLQSVVAFAAEAAAVGLEVVSVSALPYLSDANGMGDTAYEAHLTDVWGVGRGVWGVMCDV
jgi:SAM-dependent methyltransferase